MSIGGGEGGRRDGGEPLESALEGGEEPVKCGVGFFVSFFELLSFGTCECEEVVYSGRGLEWEVWRWRPRLVGFHACMEVE